MNKNKRIVIGASMVVILSELISLVIVKQAHRDTYWRLAVIFCSAMVIYYTITDVPKSPN